MAVGDHELFGIYPAIFDALIIAHLTSVAPAPGVQKMIVTAGGLVDPSVIAEVAREPVISITGHNLGALLTAISPTTGLSVSSAWKCQYQHKADGGTFTGAGANVLLSGTKGKLVIDSIAAQQDQQDPAECLMKFYALWNGSTVDGDGNPLPISVSSAQNLTGSPAVGAIYKLGKVSVEGTVLGGVQSAKATFGIVYQVTRGDGEKAARVGTIDKRGPMLECDVHNLALVAALGHGFKTATSGMVIYFRRIGFADGSANHLSVTLGAGAYETTPNGTSKEGKAVTKLMLTGTGTVAINTAVAIP